jgi:hypothetical protein
MSHFTVLVIGEDYEKQLAPYQENNMGDCPKEFMQFNDVTEEYKKQYEEDGRDMIKMPDGTLVSPYDQRFKVMEKPNCYKTVIPDDCQKVEIKYKDMYDTFEKFMEEECDYEVDPETGKPGYWENPNRKWDWYQVGGRWCGFFKLKEGSRGELGTPGLMTEMPESGADSVMKKDVDWEGMRKEAGDSARKAYQELAAAFGGAVPKLDLRWKEIIKTEPYASMDPDERRGVYHNQPALLAMKALYDKKLKEAKEKSTGNKNIEADELLKLLRWGSLEDFQCTEEEYVQRAQNQICATYAIVKDGKWYERGEMGWFGVSINEKDDDVWYSEYAKLLNELPDDTLLTVVDCHI